MRQLKGKRKGEGQEEVVAAAQRRVKQQGEGERRKGRERNREAGVVLPHLAAVFSSWF